MRAYRRPQDDHVVDGPFWQGCHSINITDQENNCISVKLTAVKDIRIGVLETASASSGLSRHKVGRRCAVTCLLHVSSGLKSKSIAGQARTKQQDILLHPEDGSIICFVNVRNFTSCIESHIWKEYTS
jgi:hypothetical protein